MKQLVSSLTACVSFCATFAHAAPFDAEVRDQQGLALVDAVVSLTPVSGAERAASSAAVMDQRGLKFVPQVLVVQNGTAVSFPNSDQVRHHVYSFSPAKKFELRLYKDTPTDPLVFEQAGVATIGCNIHDWMLGYVVVVDTPWFAKSDAGGHARIELPPGEYDLRVWHARGDEAKATVAQRLRIEAGGLRRELGLDVRAPDPEPAPPSELEQKFRKFRKKPADDA